MMIKKFYIKIINILLIIIIKLLVFIKNKVRRIRKIEFEYFSDKYRLYTKKYFFIIFGKDKYISKETYVNGPHDYHLFKKSKTLLNKKIKYLIDVGANIGTFCIPPTKDRLIEKCIAIEPVEKINDILKINIILNELNNKIKTYKYVISDKKNENLSLTLNKNNYGDNKFKISKNRKKKFTIVKLDFFINYFDLNQLLIKIDVQGFENKVLMSATKFLNKSVPLIIEFDHNFIKQENSYKIIRLIKNKYNFFSLLDKKNIEKEKIENFDKIFYKIQKNKTHLNCLIY